jgi:hypothetical protein
VTKKSPEKPLLSIKRLTVSPAEIADQGQVGYQEILAKTKTSPKGRGAVRPATRGGLTSYTKQEISSKNSKQTARKRPEISPERSSDQGEQTHREKSGKIKTFT